MFLVCDKRKNCLIDQPTVYGELVSHENVDGGNSGPLSIQASDGFIVETVNKVGNCKNQFYLVVHCGYPRLILAFKCEILPLLTHSNSFQEGNRKGAKPNLVAIFSYFG